VRLGKNSKVELIKNIPLFAHLSRKELAEVASVADEIDVPAGKVIIHEGERGREFFVLVEGTAEVSRGGHRLATYTRGDFTGEIAVVARVPRTATVTTTSDTRWLVVTDQALRGLLRKFPDMQLKVLQAVAERVVASH
jgi:CRP/FNR family transcriptional regulator, cyclic AMP receptor protein